MSITSDFSTWNILHGLIDGIKPPFGFIRTRHVSFVSRDDMESMNKRDGMTQLDAKCPSMPPKFKR